MFATPFTAFHTILSLVAIVAGAFVMLLLTKNRRPDVWTLTFLIAMIATDVTGFMFPFTRGLMGNAVEKILSGLAVRTSTQISNTRAKGSAANLTYDSV